MGNYSYRLSDGKIWNSRRLVPSFALDTAEIDPGIIDDWDEPHAIGNEVPEVGRPLNLHTLPPQPRRTGRATAGVPARRLIEEI